MELKFPLQDDDAAREALESLRWPTGPNCPHCHAPSSDILKMDGKAHRDGVYNCRRCRKQFTVTVGTVMHRSKLPLSKWWRAVFTLARFIDAPSVEQLRAEMGVTYKTAWWIDATIRKAMEAHKGPTRVLGARVSKHVTARRRPPAKYRGKADYVRRNKERLIREGKWRDGEPKGSAETAAPRKTQEQRAALIMRTLIGVAPKRRRVR